MGELKWTKKRPTKPGWYWLGGDGCLPAIHEIFEAPSHGGRLRVSRFAWLDELKKCTEFAGPIPEPEGA